MSDHLAAFIAQKKGDFLFWHNEIKKNYMKHHETAYTNGFE